MVSTVQNSIVSVQATSYDRTTGYVYFSAYSHAPLGTINVTISIVIAGKI